MGTGCRAGHQREDDKLKAETPNEGHKVVMMSHGVSLFLTYLSPKLFNLQAQTSIFQILEHQFGPQGSQERIGEDATWKSHFSFNSFLSEKAALDLVLGTWEDGGTIGRTSNIRTTSSCAETTPDTQGPWALIECGIRLSRSSGKKGELKVQ
ncbi:hypothetical protein HAX54_045585 [Datura stramonium]|uniref:Uncharacterized protein n=1 Tax=Datura stramonium TaxID=4076 RepID=A0ABS8WJX1_DATST|nr:hypothetical protein [Datura stramonium]